jgi:endonuclease V-like protein UPF0215 family
MYNIVDLKKISESLNIPVIGITYQESKGIDNAIRHHFQDSYETKLREYKELVDREKITLHTSFDVYVRKEGCTLSDVKHLINDVTLQGSFPEPLRVAQLLAKTLLQEF